MKKIIISLILFTLISCNLPQDSKEAIIDTIVNNPTKNPPHEEKPSPFEQNNKAEEIIKKSKIDINDFYSLNMSDDPIYFTSDDQDLIFRANYDNKILDETSILVENSPDLDESMLTELFLKLSKERLLNQDINFEFYIHFILQNISQTPFTVNFETIAVDSNIKANGLPETSCFKEVLYNNFKQPLIEANLQIITEVYFKCLKQVNMLDDKTVNELVDKIKNEYISFNNFTISEEDKNLILFNDYNNDLTNVTIKKIISMEIEANELSIIKFMIEYSNNSSLIIKDSYDFIIYNLKMMTLYQIYKEIDLKIINTAFSSEIPAKCILSSLKYEDVTMNNQLDIYDALYYCLKI